MGVEWSVLKGSGCSGRIVERDVRAAAVGSEPRVSPLARRMAQDLGVNVGALAAQTPGRRITRVDIEAAARQGRETPPQVTPISPVRRLIAERLATSAHTVAGVTLTTEADATELVHLREQLKSDPARAVPSYTDLMAKLCAEALREHPALNARFEGDTIVHPSAVAIGIAVDTGRGLLVPVVRDAQAKTLRQIATESAALIEQARDGRINADDLRGGTFTVTNLGMYEIDAFTPIINLPECAILGVGRVVPKQVVVDAAAERLAIRHMVFLSLTFDHRLVDGAPAARFLQCVKQFVERPYLWLVP
jgi:pyruvate dehydrogenase E2 component (dihydrolipoamide acetyltransferase)